MQHQRVPGFYDRILAAIATVKIAPHIAEEVWPHANGVGLVRAGVGATSMPPSEAKQLPPDIVFRALTDPAPESRFIAGWRATPEPEPALAAFLGIAAEKQMFIRSAPCADHCDTLTNTRGRARSAQVTPAMSSSPKRGWRGRKRAQDQSEQR